MVSIESENIYALRSAILQKAIEGAENDPLKIAFLISLYFVSEELFIYDDNTLSVYQKCAISGFFPGQVQSSSDDFSRLLGQASKIDGIPRSWVSDVWGVLGIKLAIDAMGDANLKRKFDNWVSGFLPERISSKRLNVNELDMARYLIQSDEVLSSPCIALYLNYKKNILVDDFVTKQNYIDRFLEDFKKLYSVDLSPMELALYVYVFDQINFEASIVPPNTWGLDNILRFLEGMPASLKRWTWEEKARTKGGVPRKWHIDNEYHVQNLLYVMLAPIFQDISDEENLESIGQKNPRVDIYLPSVHTIVEVKYRKNNSKSFSELIGEIGEDISLYRSDPKYKDCQLVCFLWDNTRSTQEHVKFKDGVLKMDGIQGCVVVSSPSVME